MNILSSLFCFFLAAIVSGAVLAEVDVGEPSFFAASTQMAVVTTADWNAVEGWLQRYDRAIPGAAWVPVGEPISVVVGKHGLGWGVGVVAIDYPKIRDMSDPVKKEGDGTAPAGVFALGTSFGYATEPLLGSKMPYLHLTASIECVDDPNSKYYNRVIDRSAVSPDWNSSEHMRSIGEYRWGIVIDHNGIVTDVKSHPPVPGAGSCVFLHIWRGPGQGTAGCTAMPQIDLETLLTWLDPKRKPLLLQLPEAEYARLVNRWKLPAPASVPPK
ncbi:MAG TPA: hypothetical protein VGM18_10480 [Candidatus Sulfotelmatobacter sp.]|jgi:D-alanyl-D-alanine dipeptidase